MPAIDRQTARRKHLLSRARLIAGAAAIAAACVSLALSSTSRAVTARTAATTPATIHVQGPATVAPTSRTQGFLGIAAELSTIPTLGGSADDLDVPFVHLLKSLSPGAPPLLRLGGNSTDDSWWPTPGIKTPPYLYTLTPQWGANVRALLAAAGARALIGVNLEQDSGPLAAAEVAGLERSVGAGLIDAFELGNEPEFFPLSVPRTITGGRARNLYRYAHYGTRFATIAAALGHVPLAGPSTGSPHWLPRLGTVLHDMHTHLKLVTIHAYPLKDCSRLTHLSVSAFFSHQSIQGLADAIRGPVLTARAHGAPLRVDEINGVSCGGEAGLSNSFGEALWALNVLPALWRAGVAGVNFQTIDGGPHFHDLNQMFSAHHSAAGWRVSVEPVYYGLRAFADAVPAGSRLLSVSASGLAGLEAYAVRAPDGSRRVVLTDVGAAARTVEVSLPGARGDGTVSLLSAGSLTATGGVTLGGRHLSTRTGELVGTVAATRVRPHAGDVYAVRVPAHAAAILSIPG